LLVLQNGSNEILIDPNIIKRARLPIQRLLDFSRQHGKEIYGNSDA
jgi:quinolinate synthase